MPKFEVRQLEDMPIDHYIDILEGEFAGTHLSFGTIQILGEDDDGFAHVKFDYEVLNLTEGIDAEERKEDLDKLASDVLHDILIEMANNNNESELSEETRTDNTE